MKSKCSVVVEFLFYASSFPIISMWLYVIELKIKTLCKKEISMNNQANKSSSKILCCPFCPTHWSSRHIVKRKFMIEDIASRQELSLSLSVTPIFISDFAIIKGIIPILHVKSKIKIIVQSIFPSFFYSQSWLDFAFSIVEKTFINKLVTKNNWKHFFKIFLFEKILISTFNY